MEEINSVDVNSLKDSDCFCIGLKRFHELSQAFNTHSGPVYLVVALYITIMLVLLMSLLFREFSGHLISHNYSN